MRETVIPAKQRAGDSLTAHLAAAASCRNQIHQPTPSRTIPAMPALPTPELTFLGCRVLHRAGQALPNPTAFQRSFSSMAKPASFSTSQGQSEETQHRVGSTSTLPGCRAQSISAEHHRVLLSATSTISCSAHPLLAGTDPQPFVPSAANGRRWKQHPAPAQPSTAHTQLRGQLRV